MWKAVRCLNIHIFFLTWDTEIFLLTSIFSWVGFWRKASQTRRSLFFAWLPGHSHKHHWNQELSTTDQLPVKAEEKHDNLIIVGRLGQKECLMELLDFGSREPTNVDLDLNQEDKSGFSPLVHAVYGGHTDMVVALTERFVSLNVTWVLVSYWILRAVDQNRIDVSQVMISF